MISSRLFACLCGLALAGCSTTTVVTVFGDPGRRGAYAYGGPGYGDYTFAYDLSKFAGTIEIDGRTFRLDDSGRLYTGWPRRLITSAEYTRHRAAIQQYRERAEIAMERAEKNASKPSIAEYRRELRREHRRERRDEALRSRDADVEIWETTEKIDAELAAEEQQKGRHATGVTRGPGRSKRSE